MFDDWLGGGFLLAALIVTANLFLDVRRSHRPRGSFTKWHNIVRDLGFICIFVAFFGLSRQNPEQHFKGIALAFAVAGAALMAVAFFAISATPFFMIWRERLPNWLRRLIKQEIEADAIENAQAQACHEARRQARAARRQA